MSLLEILILLVVAGVCGAVGQAIVGTSRGALVSVAVGFVGAMLGTWMARLLGLPAFFTLRIGGQPFPVLWAILGAALFVAVIALVTGARTRPARSF